MHLKIVVSGQGIEVVAARHRSIRLLIKDALLQSGNIRGALAEWELRTVDGRLLEPGVKLRDAGVSHCDTLFLSPRCGVGACFSACAALSKLEQEHS
jgi:hypothetical protein